MYEREYVAYKTLIPATPELHSPKVYYANFDSVSGDIIFLMENMNQFYSVGNQLGGCSAEDAKAILSEIAKLHGAWWENPRIQAGGDLHASFAPFAHMSPDSREQTVLPYFEPTVVSISLLSRTSLPKPVTRKKLVCRVNWRNSLSVKCSQELREFSSFTSKHPSQFPTTISEWTTCLSKK